MAVGPNPVTRVLIKGEFGHRDTQGDGHVKMEAEAGNAAGGWERPRAGSLSRRWKDLPCPHLDLWLLAPQLRDNASQLFAAKSVAPCSRGPGRLTA